ncbi:MAG: class I SAM-dependent methyltransferase [Alphaproteobacteria bacterium]|jgi:SAM-dependent methyltransferase|nr:class I SAM-dependent methyltransferase [Alphaproteobacteria bacterium]
MHKKSQTLISNSTFSAAMQEADGYNRWILDYHRPYLADPLLEIGLGHGTFYEYFCEKIRSYVGLDIDQTLVEHAQKNYPDNQYVCADLSSKTFTKEITQHRFNSILCLNVLEHIEDHEKALKNMLNVLTPSGHILLFVPAFQALYTDLDRLAGHYRRYTIKDMTLLANKCGGSIVEWSYFNFLGGIGWWINRFMSHKSLNDPSVNQQVRFFNKIVLPFSKLIQPLTKKFFGQSLYVILKKDVT